MEQEGVYQNLLSFLGNTLLVALDVTGYFSSANTQCDQCSMAHYKDGRTVYSHSVLMAAVVAPKMGYLFTTKADSQRYLFEEIASLEKLGEVHFLERTHWTGR